MEKEENLVKAFTGTEPNALLLKQMLEEIGVSSLIKNDSIQGFLGARPEVVNLYIFEEDMEKAKPLIDEMKKQDEPEEPIETEEPKKPEKPKTPQKPKNPEKPKTPQKPRNPEKLQNPQKLEKLEKPKNLKNPKNPGTGRKTNQ